MRGRSITDWICVTSEAINLLDSKTLGGYLALKLEIRKAFDTIDWKFLLDVLVAFGLCPYFCSWIEVVLKYAKLSMVVNGHPVEFFPCKRGVRQGDSLSPLLFCIDKDGFSRGISMLVDSGKLVPMVGPRGFRTPSHVLYADDIMVFCKGTRKNLKSLMDLFNSYVDVSGQCLSLQKCKSYAGAMSPNRIRGLSNLLGFYVDHLPFTYLGVPIFKGKLRTSHLQSIADRIKSKLDSWKGSMLSFVGRVQLAKSIIHGMLVYNFHVYAWPIFLLKTVDRWIKDFIWSGNIFYKEACYCGME